MCSVSLSEGVLIPVFSGKAPVSERMVGMAFVGSGELAVSFPDRSDAWRFSNHMVRMAGVSPQVMAPILQQGAPYTTHIDRGMVLSADPETLKLLYNLEPIKSGVMVTAGEEGVDEVYVVTEHRGGVQERVVATNLLANRRNQLERAGLDPQVLVRQDRLLHEELGLPGDQLRLVADFRTDTALRVASVDGAVLGPDDYDRWLTCYRDGQDMADTGYRTMAFSLGTDTEQRRHFMRFSGERYHPLGAKGDLQPPVRLEPISADSTIEVRPSRRGLEQQGVVETTMTLKAVGASVQHVALRMPTGTALPSTWRLESLTLEDGTPLAMVGLTSGLAGRNGQLFSESGISDGGADVLGTDAAADAASSAGQAGSSTIQASTATDTVSDSSGLGTTSENLSLAERDTVIKRTYRYDVLALLPTPVPAGETITLRLRWRANWAFANFSVIDGAAPDGSNIVRSLGPTTGAQPFLPEVLPSPGGTLWDHVTTLGAPTPLLRTLTTVISGDTEEVWVDEGDNWQWVRSRGTHQRAPSLALGRWYMYEEGPADALPSVRVNLFPSMGEAMPMFPPEIRRIATFYDRFLPGFPLGEVEVFQGPSAQPFSALLQGSETVVPGLVNIQQISATSVTSGSAVRRESPYLAQRMIARQLAGQYWGQYILPASSREQWLLDAMVESFAYFYVRGAYGFDVYADMMAEVRDDLENPRELSLGSGAQTDWKKATASRRAISLTTPAALSDIPDRVRQGYGAYVVAEMLRNRLGDQVFFSALDRFVQENAGKRVTTEQLQTTLEETAGYDLSGFFDYWVHGGYIPAITVSVLKGAPVDGVVRGCITSDVPYGVLDLPIRVQDQGGERMAEALVDVRDGQGYFEVRGREGEVEIEVDPYGMILARERTVRVVDVLPCADVFDADAGGDAESVVGGTESQ